MSDTSSISKTRWEFLDAVRGVAALTVVIQHFLERLSPTLAKLSLDYWSPGRFGVVIFFLVSGFLVPRSLEVKSDLKEFWKARFFRLFPLYWFNLALCVLLGAFGLISLHQFDPSNPVHLIANLLMIQDVVRVPTFNLMSWTLGMEMVLYLLVSVFFKFNLLTRTRILIGSILTLLTIPSILFPLVLDRRFPSGAVAVFASILSGLVLYRFFTQKVSWREVLVWQSISLVTIAVSAILNNNVNFQSTNEPRLSATSAILSAITGFMFFILIFKNRERHFPAWVLWLGLVSYSVYLLHGFAIALIGPSLPVAISFPLQIIVTLAISAFGFYCVEKPGLLLGKRFTSKRTVK